MQYSHSSWFLDGRTSMLVSDYVATVYSSILENLLFIVSVYVKYWRAHHCSLSPNGYFNLPSAPHPPLPSPTPPPPTTPHCLNSICDITGTEKNYLKNPLACGISYKMIVTYITLFMQDIWHYIRREVHAILVIAHP